MDFQIAQLNIAKMLFPLDAPEMQQFRESLDRINALADESAGFVWRLRDEENSSTSFRMFDDECLLVNMSVWTGVEALKQFVYRSAHTDVLKKKKEWFARMMEGHMVLWYIQVGTIPTLAEAQERLLHLRTHGESPYAFTFKKVFAFVSSIAPRPFENNPD